MKRIIALLLTVLAIWGCSVMAAPLPTSAIFTWDWIQAANTPDAAGFRILLGTSPQTYTRTVDIPGGDARTATVNGLDLNKINYAIVLSYTDFGLVSVPTPEKAFGGTPSPVTNVRIAPGT